MSNIPLLSYRHLPERPISFEIGRIEDKSEVALAAYPRRHTFFEILWLDEGSGTHFVDFKGYPIRPKTLYFIKPYQVHYWAIETPISGYAIIFEEEFFHLNGLKHFLTELNFFQIINNVTAVYLPKDEAEIIDSTVHLLAKEYEEGQYRYTEAIVGLMQFLLVWAQRFTVKEWQSAPNNAKELLTKQFLALLEANFKEQHSPKWYAQELGVSAGYLTKAVQETMGVPAGTLLRQRLIIEAKRWLVHSDWTVTRIANLLHFTDDSYFVRFFKRETGVTPRFFSEDFRKTWQGG